MLYIFSLLLGVSKKVENRLLSGKNGVREFSVGFRAGWSDFYTAL
jgi:hypothetical protein